MTSEKDPEMSEDYPYNPERNRGVLTRNDRDWIVNRPKDLNESTKRQKAQRIRDRLHQSILDFPILLHHMDYADLQRAFQDRTELVLGAEAHFTDALFDVMALLYLGTLDRNEKTAKQDEGWLFAMMAEDGIRRALVESGSSVENVEVSVDIERGPRFEEMTGELTDQSQQTLWQMQQAGEITIEEFGDALVKMRDRRSEKDSETDDTND